MKTALVLSVLMSFSSAFAITNVRAKCFVQGNPDLSFIVVRSQTSSQTLWYVNGTLASVRVAEGNWPAEPGALALLNPNGTVRAVVVCDKGE
jgi:hypothetical protein